MLKKLLILIVLAALAYGTYHIVTYFSGPIMDIKKQGGDQSVPDGESSLFQQPIPKGSEGIAGLYFV